MARTQHLCNWPLARRFWERVDKSGECWLWTGKRNRRGYGRLSDRGRGLLAHRVAWQLEHGGLTPGDLFVCHHCDNPSCVRPSHLFLGTQKDNMSDASRKGRAVLPASRGERNGAAVLTAASVREIRLAHARGGITQRALAGQYGVTHHAIWRVVHRLNWSHVG